MCVLTPTKTRPSVRDDFFRSLSLSACVLSRNEIYTVEKDVLQKKDEGRKISFSPLDWRGHETGAMLFFQIQSSPWVANGREEQKEIDFRLPTHLSSKDRLLTRTVQCCEEDYSRTSVILVNHFRRKSTASHYLIVTIFHVWLENVISST